MEYYKGSARIRRHASGHAGDVHHFCFGSRPMHISALMTTLRDPVCGMKVNEQSPYSLLYEDKKYYFCSNHCKAKFAANPLRYLVTNTTPTEPMEPAGAIYACPFHAKQRQEYPGHCPLCGLRLELRKLASDAAQAAWLKSFVRRFWWILPMVPLLILVVLLQLR